LNRQKIIAEPGLRRRGQHHKHHDRAVHGHQRQILLRRHQATLEEKPFRGGPSQMQAHQE